MNSTLQWFGTRWNNAPITREAPERPVPVGSLCNTCLREFTTRSSGLFIPYVDPDGPTIMLPHHRSCFLDTILGLQ